MSNPRWPIELFGQDLNRAWPERIQNVGGYRVDVPSRVKLPFTENIITTTAYIVTTSPASIPALTELVIVNRVAPTATTLLLPPKESQQGIPMTILDWSSGILGVSLAEHTITLDPDAAETIMRESTYAMVSNSVQLTHLTIIPLADFSGWGIT